MMRYDELKDYLLTVSDWYYPEAIQHPDFDRMRVQSVAQRLAEKVDKRFTRKSVALLGSGVHFTTEAYVIPPEILLDWISKEASEIVYLRDRAEKEKWFERPR